jgi:HEAT repeat protein
VPQLIHLLGSLDGERRAAAAACLSAIGPDAKAATARLILLLDDPDYFVSRNAVIALGAIHAEPQTVVPALVAKLNGQIATHRLPLLSILTSLSAFGTNAALAIPTLRRMLADTNLADIRPLTAVTLDEITGPAAAGSSNQ